MLMYGLTDKGNILKLKVVKDVRDGEVVDVITKALVLDTKSNEFTKPYSVTQMGNLVINTITEEPKEIFDRISDTRKSLEEKETAFMANLFLLEEDNSDFNDDSLPEDYDSSDEEDLN